MTMMNSLYSKLALALLGFFCLLWVSIVIFTLFASDMYQQEGIQKLNRNLARQIVAKKILMTDHQINRMWLNEIFNMLMVVNPGIEVYLLDPAGNILAYSAPPGKVKLDRVDLEPIKKWFEKDMVYPLTGDDPHHPGKKKVFSVARIPEQGPLQGYLYIILGGERFDNVVQKLKDSYILQLSFWWIAASLVFVFVTGMILFAYLTRRLRRLAAVMDSLDIEKTPGQLQSLGAGAGRQGDEIDRLTATFRHLIDRIQMQMEKLKETDTLRRELVTNVSHDLRTPLATLQGYIETLFLKNDILTTDDRKRHLEIAIRHCERLSKLIDEFFELAKLDLGEIKIRCEPFNIIDLTYDVVRKFDLLARERQITLQVDLNPELPFVTADIAMIERILENLLENALRYTPAGGVVRLTLVPQNGDVFFQISDTGFGIPEEDLPYIFDRFYQKDNTQQGKPRYSGLGLAIVKRILELHNRPIHVKSTLNSGTTFGFSLSADHSD
jgi:two-component system, OmpR family, sensor kinase